MVTGEQHDYYAAVAAQEEWYRFAISAKALGGSAWELRHLPEPERTFWYWRGLAMNRAENDAYNISHPPQFVASSGR